MKINLELSEVELFIHNALCNGLGYISSYGLTVKITKEEYNLAKKSVGFLTTICYEDVLMAHLRGGNNLNFFDSESEEIVGFNLLTAHKNLEKDTCVSAILDMVNENDDAVTADVILQHCIYGEVIFG